MSAACVRIAMWLACGMLVGVPGAKAASDVQLHGSMRGNYFTSSRDLDGLADIKTGELWLNAKGTLASNVSFAVDGFAQRFDPASARGRQGALREAYVDFGNALFDFRVGKQIIAWGRADKLNPTDNLTPRNYTKLVTDTEDQRMGTTGLQMRYMPAGSELALVGIYLPRVEPNITPLEHQPGLGFREDPPGKRQLAVKLDRSGGNVDWSLSFLDGVNLNPDLELASASDDSAIVTMRHVPVRVLGADAATVLGRYGLRAEAAYTWTRGTPVANGYSTKPFFHGVIGADRTFDGTTNVNVQLFLYRVSGYVDPRTHIADLLVRKIATLAAVASQQGEASRRGASMRLSRQWLNDTLEGELLGVVALGTRDHAMRASLRYALDDRIKLTVGGERFRGRPDTFFGRLSDASSGFAEIRASF